MYEKQTYSIRKKTCRFQSMHKNKKSIVIFYIVYVRWDVMDIFSKREIGVGIRVGLLTFTYAQVSVTSPHPRYGLNNRT